jgi:hypothetical protein
MLFYAVVVIYKPRLVTFSMDSDDATNKLIITVLPSMNNRANFYPLCIDFNGTAFCDRIFQIERPQKMSTLYVTGVGATSDFADNRTASVVSRHSLWQ